MLLVYQRGKLTPGHQYPGQGVRGEWLARAQQDEAPSHWPGEEDLNQNRPQTEGKGDRCGVSNPLCSPGAGRREWWGQSGKVISQTWRGQGRVRAWGGDHQEKLMCLENEGKGVWWESGPKVPPGWSCSGCVQSLRHGAGPVLCVSTSRRRRGGVWPPAQATTPAKQGTDLKSTGPRCPSCLQGRASGKAYLLYLLMGEVMGPAEALLMTCFLSVHLDVLTASQPPGRPGSHADS